MRLATYRAANGSPRVGVVITGDDGDDQIIDVVEASGDRLPAGDLLTLLEAGPEAMQIAAMAGRSRHERRPISTVELLAPLGRPPKLIAAAGNYQAHIVEGGAKPVDKTRIVPKLFLKPSSSIVPPGGSVAMPTISKTLDWELELAVVIGQRGRDIPVVRALDHVAGYTVINDISLRTAEWGISDRDPSEWDLFFDWLVGKWGDGFAPFGPWLVTADEIPDPQALQMRLSVNGTVFQAASTSAMIFSTAELIAFASRFMTLELGDVFATGTPAGVGHSTGTYLVPGDTMEGWIEGIGTLVTSVRAASPVV